MYASKKPSKSIFLPTISLSLPKIISPPTQKETESKHTIPPKVFQESSYTQILNHPIQRQMRKNSNKSSQSKSSLSTTCSYFLNNKLYFNDIKTNEEFYMSDLSLEESDSEDILSFDSSDNENDTKSFDEKSLINKNEIQHEEEVNESF